MTLATLMLLRDLLAAQQLSVGAEGFAETVKAVSQAMAELDEAIAAATSDDLGIS